ncbi:MAG: ABC transporter ATP-binding protein/permease [Hyphomicrobiaceae bacterium]|nr:ABC transporter ATP-binding protein/permease [Hyphomicrobiaceae bacterium]
MASDVAASNPEVDPDAPPARPETDLRRALVRRFFKASLGFWSRQNPKSYGLSLGLLAIIILGLGASYAMNLWNREIFDALQQKDAARVSWLSGAYFALLAFSVGLSVTQVYARTTLQRHWRAWLSGRIMDRWLSNGRYYQLNLVPGDHTNPESRIVDDVRLATESPVDFVSGIIQAFLSAATFMVVLWTLGGSLDISIGSLEMKVPGFLVIAALLYALIASGAMLVIGRKFVHASETKNEAEAEYRYTITRLRENGESIALIRGEDEERAGVDRGLDKVVASWRDITWQTMKTTMVSQTSSYIAPVLPIILCAPKLLAGTMSLGEVMQAASAFTIVQGAFNWLVDNYPRMADWTASASRVSSLLVALDGLDEAEQDVARRITIRQEPTDAALRLENVSVHLNDGSAVVSDTDVVVMPGERVLVAGESGSGKSTLVRAIAGLWPWGGGTVTVKSGAKMFLLPQRPYVPTGTLRRAAAYPEAADAFPIEDIATAFEKVGLGPHIEKLEVVAPWDQTLSGGEKQRLAFARILIHKPDIVVLDEATAALDTKSQLHLMELLVSQDGLTVLSVGHREELEQFHSRRIELERREGGAKLVRDIELGPPVRVAAWRRLRGLASSGAKLLRRGA